MLDNLDAILGNLEAECAASTASASAGSKNNKRPNDEPASSSGSMAKQQKTAEEQSWEEWSRKEPDGGAAALLFQKQQEWQELMEAKKLEEQKLQEQLLLQKQQELFLEQLQQHAQKMQEQQQQQEEQRLEQQILEGQKREVAQWIAGQARQEIQENQESLRESLRSSKGSGKGKDGKDGQKIRKGVLCRFHQQGHCRQGTSCPFAHSSEELLSNSAPMVSDPIVKSPCKFFLAGYCGRGDLCAFPHIEPAQLSQAMGTKPRPKELPVQAATGENAVAQAYQAEFLKAQGLDSDQYQALQSAMLQTHVQQSVAAALQEGAGGDELVEIDPQLLQAAFLQGYEQYALMVKAQEAQAEAEADPTRPSDKWWEAHHSYMCRFHLIGRCKNGARCKYPHSKEELIPKLLSQGVCKAFLVSGCGLGDLCKNSHKPLPPATEMPKDNQCQYFMRGNCIKGKFCNFSHDIVQKRAVQEAKANAASERENAR